MMLKESEVQQRVKDIYEYCNNAACAKDCCGLFIEHSEGPHTCWRVLLENRLAYMEFKIQSATWELEEAKV